MPQTNSVNSPIWLTRLRKNSSQIILKPALYIGVAYLLSGVVLLLSGCASSPPIPQVSVYRPPASLMTPAKTNYLLPETMQRSTTAP